LTDSTKERILKLRKEILEAKSDYYYNDGKDTRWTDAEYDAMEDELKKLSPNDPVLALVGAPVPKDSMLKEATHAMPMGSQDKVNSVDEFLAWANKYKITTLQGSLKGDGASVAAYYREGRLFQVIGRGDGFTGEDITANAYRFKGLPNFVETSSGGFTGSVRFEGILTVADWAIVDPAMSKNPRNAGNGIMRRKDGTQSELITAYAFDIDEYVDGDLVAWKTEDQKINRLVELGFNVIDTELLDSPADAIEYFKRINETRADLPIWIDGIVLKINDVKTQKDLGVSDNCPRGQTSWKFDSAGAESVLESVVVTGGHTGGLFPTAKFRPVEIGGTTVTSASLSNYEEIARLGIAIGDSIWVIKANDIIPKVIRVTERPAGRVPIPVPSCCPFCAGEVGPKKISSGKKGAILVCKNPECEKKSTGKIGRWIASLDILGIGDALLEALIERFDLEDAAGLYTLHERKEELAQLVVNVDRDLKFGEKRTASLLGAIDGKRELTVDQFLGSLGLDYLGKRRVELMSKAAPGKLDTLEAWRTYDFSDPELAAQAGVPGMGPQIHAGIAAMSGLMDRLLAAGVTVKANVPKEPSESDIALKTLCISGVLPSGKKKAFYKEPLLAAGYSLVDEVKAGLNFLVLADPTSTSDKSKKAKKLGIEIISEEQMQALIDG
jgi:DNA ligase (NAD+)